MKSTSHYCNNILLHLILTLALGCSAIAAQAFAPDTYAGASVLASGRWVKISVSATGMHLIPSSTLRQWGFSSPDKVRVYGYGGNQLPDALTADTYIDDLPEAPSEVTSRGLVFYARGPVTWTETGTRKSHSLNRFSSVGYYFLTESDGRQPLPVIGSGSSSATPQTTFTCGTYHEVDLISPGATGHLMCGEDFAYTPSRTFDFQLTGNTGASPVTMECSFVTKTRSSGSSLAFTANGRQLTTSQSDRIDPTPDGLHGRRTVTRKEFDISSERLSLGITYSSSSSTELARLDYLTVNYQRHIALDNGTLDFTASSTSVKLAGASTATRVWDVTDLRRPMAMNTASTDGGLTWTNEYTGRRIYTAWNDNAAMPAPVYVGTVANQNLHALPQADMVIFTLPQLRTEAERLARIHSDADPAMTVHVVEQEQVFNEFGSGLPDPNAFRRMLKMLHDRDGAPVLKYALLLGRGSYDNRAITPDGQALGRMRMPIWESEESLDNDISYTTDDIIALLDDNSGINMQADQLSIAVGRIPATSAAEARIAVDKIEEYMTLAPVHEWRNRVLLLADDGNDGIHMTQSETAWRNMLANPDGQRLIYDKIYIDAYERTGGQYPLARTEFHRALDEGVMLWCYIGHGSPTALTADGILTYSDINSMYLRRYPILYAATCDFVRWDRSTASGAELLHFFDGGGTIATVSATRPVLISENGNLSAALASEFTRTDNDGRFRTIGELYRNAKNALSSNSNKLRYVLMGDPALRIATPDNRIEIESINGTKPDPLEQLTLQANENVTVKGYLTGSDGSCMTDFNGIVSLTLYDADYSTTSMGWGDDGRRVTFDRKGKMLYTGTAKIDGGEFTLKFAMPSQIAGNFRPATINMAAYSTTDGDNRQASGTNRDIYVYGFDTSTSDDTPPVIESMTLNHASFSSGDNVNESPMLIATISDDRGINLSSAGVGQQINVTVDDTGYHDDVAQFFTPDPEADDRCAGTIAYTIPDLTPGHHTIRLRVWDTAGNMAQRSLECNVVAGLAPQIFDIYTDANPAIDQARFYITHNRPDARMTVKVTVYNLLGQPVWSSSATGRSDMFTSSPLTWDLTDGAGRRVQRGIYVYRAEISTAGGDFSTGSRKLAVTSR
ncbi:MAG: type IX secretion system sortase PorU [Muribaculaceae bacterium]|nr:type IX secretion system sortase PorU [Muribaculaceae bacterium]